MMAVSVVWIQKKDYEEWIANIARNNIQPPLNISYEQVSVNGKTVGVADIPKGKDKPYQDNTGKFYVRVGSTRRMASVNELMRLFQESGFYHFDSTSLDGSSFKDLDQFKLEAYFSRYEVEWDGESDEEKKSLLINTDVMDDAEQLTVTGALLFSRTPQKYLANASISFAHFNGLEIGEELIDKKVIEGSLDSQVDNTLAVIKNNIMVSSKIEGAKREESFQYQDKVFRELIVNAVVHRNYSIMGSRIRIFMFDDRLEFISPGRLPNTINVEKLRAGVSYAVNPVIVKFMENLRYIDKLGRGLPMVCREAEKAGKKVTFEEFGEEFKVTLEL